LFSLLELKTTDVNTIINNNDLSMCFYQMEYEKKKC
jgi:hypothetical protein